MVNISTISGVVVVRTETARASNARSTEALASQASSPGIVQRVYLPAGRTSPWILRLFAVSKVVTSLAPVRQT